MVASAVMKVTRYERSRVIVNIYLLQRAGELRTAKERKKPQMQT